MRTLGRGRLICTGSAATFLVQGLLLLGVCVGLSGTVLAQYGTAALMTPGRQVPARLLVDQGGLTGAELSQVLGRRPVLVAYWRPGDALSEQALVTAADFLRENAKDVAFFPVVVLAASQSEQMLQKRLSELQLAKQRVYQDAGKLARIFGIRKIPSFVLIDAGGTLRLVGGADIQQNGESGVSIGDAIIAAGQGKAVPTLGVLPSEPVYRMLGRKFPDLKGQVLGSDERRELSSYLVDGKKMLVFYWSPSCAHCKAALPLLNAWYEENKPKDLVIMDVARADSIYFSRAVPEMVGKYSWVHLLDTDRSISRGMLVRSTPTAYLVAADGEILGIKVGGSVDWSEWLGSR